jgi:hypothetical protein
MSVLLSGLLLALALFAIRKWSSHPMMVGGLALALSPSAVYLMAVINPNGFEIASAICLWTSGIVLFGTDWDEPPKQLMSIVAISMIMLLFARASSPVWAALIAVSLLAFARKRTLIALIHSTAARIWTVVIAVAGAVSVISIETLHSSIVLPATQLEAGVSSLTIAKNTLGQTSALFQEMIGVLGWNNANASITTILMWYAGIGFVVLLAFSSITRQRLRLRVHRGIDRTIHSPML